MFKNKKEWKEIIYWRKYQLYLLYNVGCVRHIWFLCPKSPLEKCSLIHMVAMGTVIFRAASCYLVKADSPSSKSTLVISHWELENGRHESIYNSETAITTNGSLCLPRFPLSYPSAHLLTPALLQICTPLHLVHWFWFGLQLIQGGSPAESIGSFPITCETGIENKSQFLLV